VYCGDSCFDFYDGDIKMNERIKELALQAGIISAEYNGFDPSGLLNWKDFG
jgi:hypothetical protein